MPGSPAPMLNVVSSLGLAFALGALGARVVRERGFTWGLADIPNPRSSHRSPTPKGGGIGIAAAFVVSAAWWSAPWPLWTSAMVVAIVGLASDARDLSFKPRLAVQAACAALAIAARLAVPLGPAALQGHLLALLLAGTFAITAVTNWYNFMDGIDGLAGVTGVIAFGLLGAYGILEGLPPFLTVVPLALACACAGFLMHNLPRAQVFMGDVGSVLLGFVFAASVLYASRSLREALLLGSFILPFYCDEANTVIARIRSGETLTTAHRRHVYQILVNQAGLPHPAVTAIYGALQAGIALAAWKASAGLAALAATLGVAAGALFVTAQWARRRWERI